MPEGNASAPGPAAPDGPERIPDDRIDPGNGAAFGFPGATPDAGQTPRDAAGELEIFGDEPSTDTNDLTGAYDGPPLPGETRPPTDAGAPASGPSPQAAAHPGTQPGTEGTQEGQRLYADRYQSVEQLEAGYQGAITMVGRMQSERDQAQNEVRQAMELLQRVRPILDAYQASGGQFAPPGQGYPATGGPGVGGPPLPPQPSPQLGQLAEQLGLEGDAAQQLGAAISAEAQRQAQAIVQPMLAQYLGPMQAQLAVVSQNAQQATQGQEESRRLAAVAEFARAHPDVTPGSPLEAATQAQMQAFGLTFNDREQIDFGYELATNGRLALLAAQSPEWVRSPEGRLALRSQAGITVQGFGPAPGAPNGGPPANGHGAQASGNGNGSIPAPPSARARAHVETSGRGVAAAGAPGQPVTDEVAEFIDAYESRQRGVSPIFGTRAR